jgi:hypothetical protein
MIIKAIIMSGIKSNKPTNKSKFRQGYYKLENPAKYVGDPSKIIYRSSWEYRFCRYCDLTESVENWSSEPIGIKYIHPIDGKEHTYYVDFYMKVIEDNKSVQYLAEVKPKASLEQPVLEGKKISTKKLQSYNYELRTWLINRSKFAAAKIFANNRDMKFVVVTEDFLYGK